MRFIEKNGKVARNMSDADKYVHERVAFCTPLVSMMDGGKGRRMAAFWRYVDTPEAKHTDPKTYTVYSYGDHWPLYVWDEQAQAWYGNRDKFSPTTSKHSRQVQPRHVQEWFCRDDLEGIARCGIVQFIAARMETEGA